MKSFSKSMALLQRATQNGRRRWVILLGISLLALLLGLLAPQVAAHPRSAAGHTPPVIAAHAQAPQDTTPLSASDLANICKSGNGFVILINNFQFEGGKATLQSCELYLGGHITLSLDQVTLTVLGGFTVDGADYSQLTISHSNISVTGTMILAPGDPTSQVKNRWGGDYARLIINESFLTSNIAVLGVSRCASGGVVIMSKSLIWATPTSTIAAGQTAAGCNGSKGSVSLSQNSFDEQSQGTVQVITGSGGMAVFEQNVLGSSMSVSLHAPSDCKAQGNQPVNPVCA